MYICIRKLQGIPVGLVSNLQMCAANPKVFYLHTALPELFTLHSTLYTKHCPLYTTHYTLSTIHSTLSTIHCPLYTLHRYIMFFCTAVEIRGIPSTWLELLTTGPSAAISVPAQSTSVECKNVKCTPVSTVVGAVPSIVQLPEWSI